MQLMFFLHAKAQVYTLVNALQIKRYIQMHLECNKSDKKDSKRICEYGIDRQPVSSTMPETAYFECRMLNQAIHDMTKLITKISNQVHSLKRSGIEGDMVIKSYQSVMKKLKQEQEKLSDKLEEKLKSWQPELLGQVQSVKGIGRRAASELIIYTKASKEWKAMAN